MIKYLIILLLFPLGMFSQLDSVHWIPPLYSSNSMLDHYLYISTPEPIPFQVTIEDGGGTVLATPTISQGNPFRYLVGNGLGTIMYPAEAELNQRMTGKGMKVYGASKFYANFRTLAGSQAGSLTAKGTSGAGTEFRVGFKANYVYAGYRNCFFSIMATQNNTNVTVQDYDPNVVFEGTVNTTANSVSITLNAGESFAMAVQPDVVANQEGLIGAQVLSDKPIVLNEGNMLLEGNDICIDQSIPINKLGTEYISIRANGTDAMEEVLVVASKNNTEINVNGTLVTTLLNAGDWYMIPSTYYVGGAHKNMHIEGTEPFYALQYLGGAATAATYGMNILAPINCKMTTKIDGVHHIDSIGSFPFSGGVFATTYNTATLSINGVPQTGAQPVVGSNWVTYKVSGLTGDVVIESTDRMVAGVFAVSGAYGFGGYYSGFDDPDKELSSLPLDLNSPDSCGSTKVKAPSLYDTYEWFFDDYDSLLYSGTADSIYAYNPGRYITIGTTTSGCKDTIINDNVIVNPNPIADFRFDTVCTNSATPFVNMSDVYTGSLTSRWDFGNGQTSTAYSPVNDFSSFGAGSYPTQMIVSTQFNCRDTIVKNVVVYDNPMVDFVVDKYSDCREVCIQFTDISLPNADSLVSWEWDFGNGNYSDESNPYRCIQNINDTADLSLDIKLKVTNSDGCSSDTIKPNLIRIWHNPKANFVANPLQVSMYIGEISFENLSKGANKMQWNFGDDSLSSNFEDVHYYQDTGNYIVELIAITDSNCRDTAYKTIRIKPEVSFYIPNSFSPNGDGINELFEYYEFAMDKQKTLMTIFDRWGNVVFESRTLESWDGRINGGSIGEGGVYIYRFRSVDIRLEEYEQIGTITMIR